VDRRSGALRTERLIADRWIHLLYGPWRERAPLLFNALVSHRFSALLAHGYFDLWQDRGGFDCHRTAVRLGVNLSECLDRPAELNTARRFFERRIRYWQCRPMPDDGTAVVSPADARMVAGSFAEGPLVRLKGKFFDMEELLGLDKTCWRQAFADGDWAVLRLTPDKYHYNHVPVAGRVVDVYDIQGRCHCCNPGAVVAEVTPFSKNTRTVTVIDTDTEQGTGVGLVAMIEVVALMIGGIAQCYSSKAYDDPKPIRVGMLLEKGRPKSLYRPGSSVDVLLFEKGRIVFSADILANLHRNDASSRFSSGFGRPLVETEVQVRAAIGHRA
jgi:phosphatidylserine decarboxylase